MNVAFSPQKVQLRRLGRRPRHSFFPCDLPRRSRSGIRYLPILRFVRRVHPLVVPRPPPPLPPSPGTRARGSSSPCDRETAQRRPLPRPPCASVHPAFRTIGFAAALQQPQAFPC